MNNRFILFFIVLAVFSCKNEQQEQPKQSKELVMAKTSEMANLMNEMYAFNQSLKEQIKEGKLNNSFPEKFNNIHTAVLTTPSDRDSLFAVNSKVFINAQKSLFESQTHNLKDNYTSVVNACISCHEVTCVGPISRIKKLYINE